MKVIICANNKTTYTMKTLNQTSLGDHVSRKMSVWILVLVAAITAAVFTVSFIQSRQMFLKQVASWTAVAPRQAITNLIDSDYFSIEREVSFLESTGLFSSFCVMDNQQRQIAAFGKSGCVSLNVIPIKDDAGIIWGYFSFKPDFYRFIAPFLISGAAFLVLIISLYFFIRWRIRKNLGHEFFRFNQFLQNIELLTERIQDYYQDELNVTVNTEAPQNAEQAIINRAIGKLVGEIKKANQSLREAISKAEKQRFQEELTETALQVAHDIGSPLAVLETTVLSTSSSLPEESRVVIRNASEKIKDIANGLLNKGKGNILLASNETIAQYPLLSLIQRVVSEKRLEFREREDVQINFEYSDSGYGLFSMVKFAQLSSVISNLINNAFESFESGGLINIRLMEQGKNAVIEIEDNGKGIPKDVLIRLGEMGVTYGKPDGHGLGIYHAKTTLKAWAGDLQIESTVGKGTAVSLYLPKSPQPLWFVPEIQIQDQQTVVVIDDDESIHQLWRMRLGNCTNLVHLYNPDELDKWISSSSKKIDMVHYLCDYEFSNYQVTGLDLIDKHGIDSTSLLVTSRYCSIDMMEKCEALGIKLLPKELASILPITVKRQE